MIVDWTLAPKDEEPTRVACPACRTDVRSEPDPSCTLCRGFGFVEATVAAEWRSRNRAARRD